MEIQCSEKSAKSETSNFGLRFLHFLNATSKNVKSRCFGFSKKRKIRIVELWLKSRWLTRVFKVVAVSRTR